MSQDDINTIIAFHQQFRTRVCEDPLIWDDFIAEVAQNYTNACVIQARSNFVYGQNLVAKTSPAPLSSLVSAFQDQSSSYVCGNFNGSFGTFAQVIWKDTMKIGCGLTSCNSSNLDFMACYYDPPGLVLGEQPYPCTGCANGSYVTTKALTTISITTDHITSQQLTSDQLTSAEMTTSRVLPITSSPLVHVLSSIAPSNQITELSFVFTILYFLIMI